MRVRFYFIRASGGGTSLPEAPLEAHHHHACCLRSLPSPLPFQVVWPTLRYDPFDDDYSMDEHGRMSGTPAASISE